MTNRKTAEAFITNLTAAVKAAEKKEGSFNFNAARTDHFMGVDYSGGKWYAIYQPTGSGFMTDPDWVGEIPESILEEAETAQVAPQAAA